MAAANFRRRGTGSPEPSGEHQPITREATGRLLQRVGWRSRDRRMLDERLRFPRASTELPSEAEGKDPREETSADPDALGEWIKAAVPKPARAPLPPTSDNVSYVRFRPSSFWACFPERNRSAPLPKTTRVTTAGPRRTLACSPRRQWRLGADRIALLRSVLGRERLWRHRRCSCRCRKSLRRRNATPGWLDRCRRRIPRRRNLLCRV